MKKWQTNFLQWFLLMQFFKVWWEDWILVYLIFLLWNSSVRLTNWDPGGRAESLNLFFHHYHHLSPAAGRPVRNNRISFIRLAGDINHLCTHWPPPQMMRWQQHRETIQSLLVPTGVDCRRIPSGLSIPWRNPIIHWAAKPLTWASLYFVKTNWED